MDNYTSISYTEYMKKGLKIFIIIISVLILAIFVLFLNGTSRVKFNGSNPELSSWMRDIDDAAPLNRIAIPGSHDAGTAGICWLGETQTYSIGQQLSSGVRYFDIRVHKNGESLRIYHSIFDGADFHDVLEDISEFITANPSETLVLDFQHFKGDSQESVRKLLEEQLLDRGLIVANESGFSDLQYIRQLKMGDVRGKCIVFFGDGYDCSPDWIFARNNDGCTLGNLCLDSFYIGSIHKAAPDKLTAEGHPIYLGRQRERVAAGEDGLFVLQCQLTDGSLVLGPWARERAQDKTMSAYIDDLCNSEHIDIINIIMRDFLTPDKCQQIINLNNVKGYIHG